MSEAAPLGNPLLATWSTPYGLPPFEQLAPEQFVPAFEAAFAEHRAELDAIAASAAPASFENTLLALERSGKTLKRVHATFSNLVASEAPAALQAVEREVAPRMAAHSNFKYLNAALFARIDALQQQRDTLGLDAESLRLLSRVHMDFVMAGAKLPADKRARYAAVTETLAKLTTEFSQNVLADEQDYKLVLETEADLAGLPGWVIDAAKSAGEQRGLPGKAVIALNRALYVGFLTFSTRRDLREQLFKAWTSRGAGARDNAALIKQIMTLRQEQATLHGYPSYAAYVQADMMAGSTDAVMDLLHRVWTPAKAAAARDQTQLEALARADGITELAPWDWRFYAEKVRVRDYDLDDAEIKPYFSLDRMIEAMFDCAQRLFGLRFVEVQGVKLYHPDVRLWEVRDAKSNDLRAIFLGDNFARPTKRGGAWMSLYRHQRKLDGAVLPIVVNNNNFAKAPAGQPTLLSFDDVRTLFHEFGHGLHGLLSDVTYERLSCTQVLRDFVELPSQLMEHWALEPQVLKAHARHVETGEPISDALIAKLKRARRFNQAYDSVQYTASALVDMALHMQTDFSQLDAKAYQSAELARLGMPAAIGSPMHHLVHFRHLFAGYSYAAGYYVYLWAEVLDADAFDAFVETGDIFDVSTAQRLLANIYSAGNRQAPREAYRAFRGRDAKVEPMLAKKGLLEVV